MPLPLRELEPLVRIRDTDSLRALLATATALGGEFGVDASDLERIASLDDAPLVARLDRLVRWHREQTSAHRDARLRAESAGAVVQLVETARFRDHGVQLDPALLLGPVLAEHVPYLVFHVDSVDVAVERSRLLQVRRALRPFPDVTACIGPDALRLGWHGGRGGLVFLPQLVSPSDRDRVSHVVLQRPAPAVVTAVTELPALPICGPSNDTVRVPARRPGAWLADVIDALSFPG